MKPTLLLTIIKSTIHPYLLILYFLLKNAVEVNLERPFWYQIVLIFLGFSLFIFTIFRLSRRLGISDFLTGFILTAVAVPILFTTPLEKTLDYLDFARLRYVLLAYGAILTFLIRENLRGRFQFFTVTKYLNVLLIILITSSIVEYVYINTCIENEKPSLGQFSKAEPKYNIYLWVVDGYAAPKNLNQIWHFDNSEFTTYLKDKGFYLAEKPHSNYAFTLKTMASMLNLNYLTTNYSEVTLINRIENSFLSKILRDKQYDCYYTNYTGDFFSNNNKKVDASVFTNHLLQQSIVGVYLFLKTHKIAFESENKNDVRIFEKFSNILKNKQNNPQFVYLHSMLTHTPFYDPLTENPDSILSKYKTTEDFPAKKNRIRSEEHDAALKGVYVSRIKLTNTLIQKTLNDVWRTQKDNSIFIIISDHGFRFLAGEPEDVNNESYENFCAIYFPDKDYSSLSSGITPINVMRMVLNKAINSRLSYLSDKTHL